MTINLFELPPTATKGGYVYVLAYSNNTIKVGKTRLPAKRMATHVGDAAKFGVVVQRVWMSAPHDSYSGSEQIMLGLAAGLTGDPEFADKRTEVFPAVDFDQLVDLCKSMGLDNPPARPQAALRSQPRVEVAAAGVSDPRVATRQRLLRHEHPRRAAGRGAVFAKLITDARRAAGLTQEATIARCGVAKTTLIRWETGKAERPNPDQVRTLCLALNVPPLAAAIALGFVTTVEAQAVITT